jgi:hypothetical protein
MNVSVVMDLVAGKYSMALVREFPHKKLKSSSQASMKIASK